MADTIRPISTLLDNMPINSTQLISDQDIRDLIVTLETRTGGGNVVSITEFGAVADCDGSYGSGTDNTSAIQSAISAVGRGGIVLVPPAETSTYGYRTQGNHHLPNVSLRGFGSQSLFYWDPPSNAANQYCFRFRSSKSPDDGALPYGQNVSDIWIIGNGARINCQFEAGSTGSSAAWDTLTGQTSGYTCHTMYPISAGTTAQSLVMNKNTSGVTGFTPGETVVSSGVGAGWTGVFAGENTTRDNKFGSNASGFNPQDGCGIWVGSGDYIELHNVVVMYTWNGFRYQPDQSGYYSEWMENIGTYNCRGQQIYDNAFWIQTPPFSQNVTGSCFMNEFLFYNCESRTTWGHPVWYRQQLLAGGDGKISGHTWIQCEFEGRFGGDTRYPEEFILFEVNERNNDGVYGEIEDIVFIRPTIEAAGGFNPRQFIFQFKNDQAGNSSNIGPIAVHHGIYYNANGIAKSPTQYSRSASETRDARYSPIISVEAYDRAKRFDLEFNANSGGVRDHIVKGGSTTVITSGVNSTNPVQVSSGTLHFNTSTNELWVYNGTEWRKIATSA